MQECLQRTSGLVCGIRKAAVPRLLYGIQRRGIKFMEKIKIENLTMTYHDNGTDYTALRGVNLSVEKGEFICIIGSSGCGKSTLLSAVEGLNKPAAGAVYIDGKKVEGPGVDRAVVFQHYSLFPWLTAKGNIVFGMKQAKLGLTKKQMEQEAEEYLEKVELSDAANRYPAQLSGGMQQRVAIARTLAMHSEILLMDEPFGAIDPKTRRELQALVSRLAAVEKRTVLFVTHDIDEAILLADRIVFIGNHTIQDVEQVEIPKPRTREQLYQNEIYRRLSGKLMQLFYRGVSDKIGGEQVVI